MKSIHPNSDRKIKIRTDPTRHSLMKLLVLLSFGTGLWFSGCDHRNADSALTMKVKKEGKMESTTATATIQKRLPSLDAAAPAETSTATFALG